MKAPSSRDPRSCHISPERMAWHEGQSERAPIGHRSWNGFAVSDPGGFLASPIETVTERDLTRLADRALSIAAGQGTARVVLGHPRNMDGSRGESARRAEEFAALLTERGLEVILWDERMTTLSAIGFLNQTNTRGKKRKGVVDTVAAVIILQSYLDSRKNQPAGS